MIHWCYLEFEISSIAKGDEKEKRMSDNEKDSIDDQPVGDGVTVDAERDSDTEEFLFPWEPNYTPNGSKNETSGRSATRNHDKDDHAKSLASAAFNSSYFRHERRITEQSHMEELDFLSSMTFANGGLRSPSCPCCV
eukprot:CAMPEP_0116087554 /NCGR_PEP_ID=MMETSP0327-20121206/5423_1 /TAXON_ID=44447 /ORGANISM="Pseudo-nitzschia delicatissima, Strain B596" /LENGTH=136 /DNA_ID=CAMNT_0003578625 /DNA_START=129 /DNA_END=539 /DNA_ORIENTATION=+